jgi:hypothetical protein
MSTSRCRARFDSVGRVSRWTGLPLAWLTLLAGFHCKTIFTVGLAEGEKVTTGNQMGILHGCLMAVL